VNSKHMSTEIGYPRGVSPFLIDKVLAIRSPGGAREGQLQPSPAVALSR
jgi:hypothetical protein